MNKTQSGSALLSTLALIVVGASLAAATAQMTTASYRGTGNNQYSTEAFYFAETGLEAARQYLVTNGCPSTGLPTNNNSGLIDSRGEYDFSISCTISGTACTTGIDYNNATWNITSIGYAPTKAAAQGKRSLSWQVSKCTSAIDPLIGNTNLSITNCGTNSATMNNADGTGQDRILCGTGSVVDEYANNITKSFVWPTLPTTPIWDGTGGISPVTLGNNYTASSASRYSAITFSNNRTLTLSGAAGDIYYVNNMTVDADATITSTVAMPTTYIKNLNITQSNSVLTLTPGDYFVDDFTASHAFSIVVSPKNAKVRLIILNSITVASNIEINCDVSTGADCNQDDATLFSMYLYAPVTFTSSSNLQMAGVIMAQPGTTITMDSGNKDLHGALLSQGTVNISTQYRQYYDLNGRTAALAEMGMSNAFVTNIGQWLSNY
ncbi:MAG: hypothetical protein H7839_03445 [Magnetococcus sp. YQC-5]